MRICRDTSACGVGEHDWPLCLACYIMTQLGTKQGTHADRTGHVGGKRATGKPLTCVFVGEAPVAQRHTKFSFVKSVRFRALSTAGSKT